MSEESKRMLKEMEDDGLSFSIYKTDRDISIVVYDENGFDAFDACHQGDSEDNVIADVHKQYREEKDERIELGNDE